MERTAERGQDNSTAQSIRDSWQHGKQIWTASSASEAWNAFKKMIETLPAWALVAIVIGIFLLMTNAWVVLLPLAVGGLFAAMYQTVKHAVRAALREHESERRG